MAARKLQADIEKQAVDRMRRRPSMTRALRVGDSKLGGDAFYTMENLRGVQTKGHVRPMFTVAWPHFVSVFDNLLSNEDGAKAIELVLKGLRFGIKIANTFDMHDACHAYINILTKHANLNKGKLLVMKNVECIRVLLKIAQEEGESICLCWEQLLCVMSRWRDMNCLLPPRHLVMIDSSNQVNRQPKQSKAVSGCVTRHFRRN